MKRYVTVAGIFGASKWTNLKLESGALTAEWVSRSLSNTEIPSAYRGKGTLTPKRLPSQSMKANPFCPGFGTADTWTVVILNISKSLSLLVK
jgi:hypothetical protein